MKNHKLLGKKTILNVHSCGSVQDITCTCINETEDWALWRGCERCVLEVYEKFNDFVLNFALNTFCS